jgi:hypothetical protein
MERIIRVLLIDDDDPERILLREAIKSYYKVKKMLAAGKDRSKEGYNITLYKCDDHVLEIIEVFTPTIGLVRELVMTHKNNLDIVVFDMIWTDAEKRDFYLRDDGLLKLDYDQYYLAMQNTSRSQRKALPGGLAFLYNWVNTWRSVFDVEPPIISKSAYYTENLIDLMRVFGIHHFIDSLDPTWELTVNDKLREAASDFKARRKAHDAEEKVAKMHRAHVVIPVGIQEDLLEAAASDEPVLLVGEFGCGKWMLANYIHQQSKFSQFPIVGIDSSDIGRSFEKPQFIKYLEDKIGFSISSESATPKPAKTARPVKSIPAVRDVSDSRQCIIFLENIHELDHKQQVQLVSILEQLAGLRSGGSGVFVRIIASVDNDPLEEVLPDKLVTPLYQFLKINTVRVPSLRDRREDILTIAETFVEKWKLFYKKPTAILDEKSKIAMKAHAWPGNIRDLSNTIKKAISLLGREEVIRPEHLGIEVPEEDVYGARPLSPQEQSERKLYVAYIKRKGLSVIKKDMAEYFEITRPTLDKRLKLFGLENEVKK